MNLSKKKILAAKALKVGKKRIAFVVSRVDEIKDAITKQDIKDLHKEGAIKIKLVKGRRTVVKRKHKRGVGKIKKKLNKRKQEYVTITRNLRKYVAGLKKQGKLGKEEISEIRKRIRNRKFHSLSQLKIHVGELKK